MLRSSFVTGFALALAACSSKEPGHPPFADNTCHVEPCGYSPPVGGGVHIPKTDAGAGGRGNPSTPSDAGSVALSGQVAVFDDESFQETRPNSDSGTILVWNSLGPSTAATVPFTGASWSITDAPSGTELWIAAKPDPGSTEMPTISVVSGSAASTDVVLVPTAAMTGIFSFTQQNPQSLLQNKAQVVVQFLESTGEPASGIVIVSPPGNADVAYDNGGGYTDLASQTGTQIRGTAVILNVPAVAWPGDKQAILFKRASAKDPFQTQVFLAQGAVTFVTLVAPSN